jgi:hypothetical protein
MANRTRSKKRTYKKSKKMYRQRGGAFTDDETDILVNQGGFNQEDIDFFNLHNISFENVQQAHNFVVGNNQQRIALFVASCLHNNPNQNQALDEAFIQGNNNALNNSGTTDSELDSFSFGDNNEEEDDENNDLGLNDIEGGKRRKGKKNRKTRKMRGGMRYGTGVGANCFDPNYSIYNTPALSLFPYKPN